MVSGHCNNNFFGISVLTILTEFMYLQATIQKKVFVKFLQNLEKIMKEFCEVVYTLIEKLYFS